MRARVPAATQAVPSAPARLPRAVQQVLASPGRPLDAATRANMEPRFGHDFGAVRVHADNGAAASAQALRARAFTVGRHIVFGAGNYAPGSREGRELLAHELAHTVQQRAGAGGADGALAESSAQAAGQAIAAGGIVAGTLPACGIGLARAPENDDEQDLGWRDVKHEPELERQIEAGLQQQIAQAVLAMMAQEIARLDVRLKEPHYPGRTYDHRWRDYLRAEVAKRTPAAPTQAAPLSERDAAIAELKATLARTDVEEGGDDMPAANASPGQRLTDDLMVDDAVLLPPDVELERRTQSVAERIREQDAQRRQAKEDATRPLRMRALRDQLIQHGRKRSELVALVRDRLPFRDGQVLRRYGLEWTRRGYAPDNLLAAVEKYIADNVPDDPGARRVVNWHADGSVTDVPQKMVEVTRRAAQIETIASKNEGLAQEGAGALLARTVGYVGATILGADDPLLWSDRAAAFGGLGDVAAPFVAKRYAVARTTPVPEMPPSRPAASAPAPVREPVPTPDREPVAAPRASPEPATGPRPASVAAPRPARQPAPKPAPRPQLLLPVESTKDPAIIRQEAVLDRRAQAVRAATQQLNEISVRVGDAEAAVTAAHARVTAAQSEAQGARQVAERARIAAVGAKRTSAASKDATATRKAADRADRAVAAARQLLSTATGVLTQRRGTAVRRAQQAQSALEALRSSREHLDRLREQGPAGTTRPVVQPTRRLPGPSGGTVVDRGFEGRRRDDPQPGMQRDIIFPHTDGNYQRMLDGRPPIGIDGKPINLHHRTYGPMSRLDEYTETAHRTMGLHEAGRDSEIDRKAFDDQRARYWVERGRLLLGGR